MIDRRVEICLLAVMITTVGFVCGRTAAMRPLWYDEHFTKYLAKYEHLGQLTTLLSLGADLNPPVSYILTHYSVKLFGESLLSTRLPSLLGGLIGMLSIYAFVRYRRGVFEGWLAMNLMVISESVTHFFTEARPYGLMLGWTGLLLLVWQRATQSSRPSFAYGVWMAIIGSLGMATHYYFTVPLIAIGVAELIRLIVTKQIRFMVLLGFLAPAVTLGVMTPLWRGPQQVYTNGFWAKLTPSPLEITNVFASFSDNLVITTLLLLVMLTAVFAPSRSVDMPDRGYPIWEVVALCLLTAVPILAFGLSAVFTKVYVPRYCIPFAIGATGVIAFGLGTIAGRRSLPLILCTILVFTSGLSVHWRWSYERGIERNLRIETGIQQINTWAAGQDVIIELAGPNRIDFALADAELLYRPILLLDADRSLKYEGKDTIDRGATALAALAQLRTTSFENVTRVIQAGRTQFYLGSDQHWRARELQSKGCRFEWVGTLSGRSESLYRLHMDH